jgi:type I restriction enzyme S subunit
MELKPIEEIAFINPDSIKKDYPYDEIEYIDIQSVGSGYLIESKLMPLSEAPSRAKRLIKDGDTILSTVRPNRRSFLYIKNPNGNVVVSTGFAVLRAKDGIDARYLYYTVTDQKFTDYLTLSAKGAAYPAVDTEIIQRGRIPIYPIDVQQKISSILSAYDDLIENNTRRIQILEEMAQRIYQEWFVNFKFPRHEKVKFVNSELGKIPEGWEIRNVSDIMQVLGGYPFKSEKYQKNGKYGIITIKNVQDGVFVDKCESFLNETPDKMKDYCLLSDGDILLSLTGNIGRVCLVFGTTYQNYLLNQRVAKLVPHDKEYIPFIYALCRSKEFQDKIISISTGVAQQNLSPIQMGEIKITIPVNKLIKYFAEKVYPFLQEIIILSNKNKVLRTTRDLLLPKLISGELDVSDLDIAVRKLEA